MSQKKFFSSGRFVNVYPLLVIDRNLWDDLKKKQLNVNFSQSYQVLPQLKNCKTATRTITKNMNSIM